MATKKSKPKPPIREADELQALGEDCRSQGVQCEQARLELIEAQNSFRLAKPTRRRRRKRSTSGWLSC